MSKVARPTDLFIITLAVILTPNLTDAPS